MNERFSIIDYTNPLNVTTTVIDEPVGWDNISVSIKRSKELHGFFDFWDESIGGLEFHEEAFQILKSAYEAKGVDAKVELLIEVQCDANSAFETVYTGKFAFDRYEENCGDTCYITCGIENADCLMTFRNRYDQKVDLDSVNTFDHTCDEPTTVEVGGGFNSGTQQITITSVDGYSPDDLTGLKPGDQLTVSGTASNNGVFTIVSVSLGGSSSTITVEEPLTTALDGEFYIEGCLFKLQLPQYAGLGAQLTIPPKPIQSKDSYSGVGVISSFSKTMLNSSPSTLPIRINLWQGLSPQIDELNEISLPVNNINWNDSSDPPAWVDVPLSSNTNLTLRVKITGAAGTYRDELDPDNTNTNSGCGIVDVAGVKGVFRIYKGFDYSTAIIVYEESNVLSDYSVSGSTVWTDSFTITNVDETIEMAPGEKLWIQFVGAYIVNAPDGNVIRKFSLQLDSGIFSFTSTTSFDATKTKAYLINESLSRATEIISNDCLRVKSDYFGRVDSEPYTSEENGCGSNEALTTGMIIRAGGENTIQVDDDLTISPKMTISMKEMVEGLNCIHDIGVGIEPDTERGGDFKWIRVERKKHFYGNSIITSLSNVANVKRRVRTELLYSVIKIGYAKWETENVNGLNDIFSQREYRTTLKAVRNTYERICRFIASDYALEITRRQYGATTKDWRYDNDIFIVCTTNNPYEYEVEGQILEGGIIVIQGDGYNVVAGDTIVISDTTNNNGTFTVSEASSGPFDTFVIIVAEATVTEGVITFTITQSGTGILRVENDIVSSSANILYPDNCMNLRISPIRNLIRHMSSLLNNYRNYLTAELKFTSGTGNYIAQTELSVIDCLLEAAGGIAENADLSIASLADADSGTPLLWPELVTFEYPCSWAEYKDIKANPYGLIEFQCGDGDMEYGWIEDFRLKPYEGLAEFTLIPKIPT